ncbi:MAG: hypothetical protein KY475_14430 [Planctomycetes bacterium]|nr:hypothetical protein [Planctomycetota bacterium]
MTRFRFRQSLAPVLLLAAIAMCLRASAQEPAPDKDAAPQREEEMADDALMKKLATQIELYTVHDGDRQHEAKMIRNSLMRIYDPARDPDTNAEQDGLLFGFGRSGRPVALVEVWRWKARPNRYGHTLISTSTGLVAAKVGEAEWRPKQPGLEFRLLKDAPPRAATHEQRTADMRELAKEFAAHEVFRESLVDLDLMSGPVYRYYADRMDGGIFIFAHHHNPEAILFLEVLEEEGETVWRYALAPCTSQELHVLHRGNEVDVFAQPARHVGAPTDPFWVTYVTAPEK